MAPPEEAKRVKFMLLAVVVLALVLVLRARGGSSSSSSSGGGIFDKMIGANQQAKKKEFDNAKLSRDLSVSEKNSFERLENKLLEQEINFWSYTKAGTPRGDAQQKIIRIGKDFGIDNIRVSIGTERAVSGCNYLKYIDYSISARDYDMQNLSNFMESIDKDERKFYWKEMRVYRLGKSMAFSATLRIYVLNNKATAVLDNK